MSTRLALVLALLLPCAAIAGDNNDANGENLCDDLGSECVCSTTFNGNDTALTDNESITPNTSKACGNHIVGGSGTRTRLLSTSSAPAFPTAVDRYVYETDPTGNFASGLLGPTISCSSCTVCLRFYASKTTDYNCETPPGNTPQHKWIKAGEPASSGLSPASEMSFYNIDSDCGGIYDPSQNNGAWFGGSGVNVDPNGFGCDACGPTSPSACQNSPNTTGNGCSTNTDASVRVDMRDMETSWVRTEACWDHNPPDLTANRLRVRVRFTNINTGDQTSYTVESDRSQAGGILLQEGNPTGARWHVFDFDDHPSSNTAPAHGANPRIYAANAMIVQRSVDSTFWIGAANELENVAGSPPPTRNGGSTGGSMRGASLEQRIGDWLEYARARVAR